MRIRARSFTGALLASTDVVVPVASDAIHMLIEYQGTSYAQLYVDRLKRFVGRRGLDDAVFAEVAGLMAARMSGYTGEHGALFASVRSMASSSSTRRCARWRTGRTLTSPSSARRKA